MADPSPGLQEGLTFWGAIGAVFTTVTGVITFYWRDKVSTRVGLAEVKATADQAKKTSEENREELKSVREQQVKDSTKLDMILAQVRGEA